MSTRNTETLSQLMDGEWQELDAADGVRGICADDALKAKWSRYHLIRDVIKNEPLSVDAGLASRISAAIDTEETYSNVASIGDHAVGNSHAASPDSNMDNVDAVGAGNKESRFGMGMAGAALAACVALATVVGLNVWQGAPQNNTGSVPAIATAPTVPGVVLPEVEYVSNKGSYWVTPDAKRSQKAEQRLNMLLSAHIENSPTAVRQGMLPYSRLVGYDAVSPE